jgi:hypothetical protein
MKLLSETRPFAFFMPDIKMAAKEEECMQQESDRDVQGEQGNLISEMVTASARPPSSQRVS